MKMICGQRKKGFTLIELLVVISIIGVLFVVALPVFENMGKKDTKRAALQLMTTMRLARQHAVARRQWVAVVFPTYNGGVGYKNADDEKKKLRSYAILAVTNSMDGLDREEQNPDNMDFVFASEWKYFPDGVYLDDNSKLTMNELFTRNKGKFKYPLSPDPGAEKVSMGVVFFKPNGRAYVMTEEPSAKTKKYLQDMDNSRIWITSRRQYVMENGKLKDTKLTLKEGPVSVVRIRNKTGQVILQEIKESDLNP